jgi:16S rRNA G527 N7-methylase RsmG
MKILIKWMESLGMPLGGEDIDKFIKYRDLVLTWNKKVNLTAWR